MCAGHAVKVGKPCAPPGTSVPPRIASSRAKWPVPEWDGQSASASAMPPGANGRPQRSAPPKASEAAMCAWASMNPRIGPPAAPGAACPEAACPDVTAPPEGAPCPAGPAWEVGTVARARTMTTTTRAAHTASAARAVRDGRVVVVVVVVSSRGTML